MPCTRMESGIFSGIPGIPAGGAGMLFFGYANSRTVAISMGALSVLETTVPDRVYCAITGITIKLLNIINKYFIIF